MQRRDFIAGLVDLRGRTVLMDPKMARAMIRPKRDIEDIALIGEMQWPLSTVFAGDAFAHGELLRFSDSNSTIVAAKRIL